MEEEFSGDGAADEACCAGYEDFLRKQTALSKELNQVMCIVNFYHCWMCSLTGRIAVDREKWSSWIPQEVSLLLSWTVSRTFL